MYLLLLILNVIRPVGEKDSKTITKNYEIASPENFTVMVDNIHGSVEVEPSNDSKLYLELEISFSASSQRKLEEAKKELELGQLLTSDSLIFFSKAPFITRNKSCNRGRYRMDDPGYNFKYHYKLKIPAQASIHAKTINNGEIYISNIDGTISANNINGGVTIRNARSVRKVSSVNGDIAITFLEAPKESNRFSTVNGDFLFHLPEDFKGKVYLSSMHGEMYSAFDYKMLDPKIEKTQNKHGSKFKVESETGVEIGSGGPTLSFKSINGNVYLKKLN